MNGKDHTCVNAQNGFGAHTCEACLEMPLGEWLAARQNLAGDQRPPNVPRIFALANALGWDFFFLRLEPGTTCADPKHQWRACLQEAEPGQHVVHYGELPEQAIALIEVELVGRVQALRASHVEKASALGDALNRVTAHPSPAASKKGNPST